MQQIHVWKIATLFLAGLVVGLVCLNVYLIPSSTDPIADESLASEAEPKRIQVIPASAVMKDAEPEQKEDLKYAGEVLKNGDNYLAIGNCALALSAYEKFELLSKRRDASILLRRAACYEHEAKLQFAASHYQAATSRATNDNHRALAIGGLARVLIRQQRLVEAIELLANQAVKINQVQELPGDTRAQLGLQWARALEGQALVAHALDQQPNAAKQKRAHHGTQSWDDLSYPTSLAVASAEYSPEKFLRLVDSPIPEAPPTLSRPQLEFKVLQRPSDSADAISVSVSSSLQPVMLLLAEAKSKAKVDIQFSEQAKSAIVGRSKAIEVESTTLSSLLDQLLISYSLVWHQQESTIYIVSEAESQQQGEKQSEWLGFKFDSATRAFRRFELEFPENRFRTAALLSRARLAVQQGQLDVAGNLYRELEQIQLSGEVQAKLFFNQAKLGLLLRRSDEAVRLLYQAVDQTLDPNLESSSYSLLSRLHLSAGELEESIKTGRRALTTAVTVRQKSIAAINQARGYLLTNNPFSANEALFQNKEFIEADAELVPTASMMGAYSRTMGLNGKYKHNTQKAHIRLITAVSAMSETPHTSFADYYIASLAYGSLGWRKQAIERMLVALSQPDVGTWQRQLTYELALLMKDNGQVPEAISTFRQLVNEDDLWRIRSLHQIATLYAGSNQSKECIATCRLLWQSELSEGQKSKTLQLLGEAFQRQGEHHAAALCFSGMLPNDF